jgi:predicted 2-oxoglutarate/Fe(II)-dependent dioxygenase YbiX
MYLPVKDKPKLDPEYNKFVYQIPNVISKEIAEDLKNYAMNKNISGLHRRAGYLSAEGKFSTCLVHDHNHIIYNLLDNVWQQYATQICNNLQFIESYEIKCYDTGDKFNSHIDNFGYLTTAVDRKVSMSLQLSDANDYKGGDLVIGNIRCSKEIGTAIFFPSCYYHHVQPIMKGQRFALISWAWGPR